MNPKIVQEIPVSIYDMKKELKKIQKRDEQMSIRATKTDEYLSQFVTLKQSESEELEQEITKMDVPRMKEMHVKKVVDLLPESVEELKVVLQGYNLTLTKENLQKITTAIKKYVPDKKA